MKLKVLNIEGKETGREISVSDKIFKSDPNDHVVYLAVKQYMANNRQGTHKAKPRSEITGSTRKIKKQKEQVRREQEVLNHLYLEEVVELLVPCLEITLLN